MFCFRFFEHIRSLILEVHIDSFLSLYFLGLVCNSSWHPTLLCRFSELQSISILSLSNFKSGRAPLLLLWLKLCTTGEAIHIPQLAQRCSRSFQISLYNSFSFPIALYQFLSSVLCLMIFPMKH